MCNVILQCMNATIESNFKINLGVHVHSINMWLYFERSWLLFQKSYFWKNPNAMIAKCCKDTNHRKEVHLSRSMTKPTKWHVRPSKTQFSLGIGPVWSESSLSAWRKLGSLATNWAHSKDCNQTGPIPRLIWVFTGAQIILLVLSWGDSFSLKTLTRISHYHSSVSLCSSISPGIWRPRQPSCCPAHPWWSPPHPSKSETTTCR